MTPPPAGEGHTRLIVAVVARAFEDARLQNHAIRRDAIHWLRSGEAAWLLKLVGKPIRQADIDCWLDRQTIRPRRARFQMELI